MITEIVIKVSVKDEKGNEIPTKVQSIVINELVLDTVKIENFKITQEDE